MWHTVCPPGIQLVNQEKKQHKVSSAKRARRHWQLLYTLVNNPSLVGTRKHFQRQAAESFVNGSLNRSAKEGSKKEAAAKEAEAAAAGNWTRTWPWVRIGCKVSFGLGQILQSHYLSTPTEISALIIHKLSEPFLSGDWAFTSCSSCSPGRLYARATVSSLMGKLERHWSPIWTHSFCVISNTFMCLFWVSAC